MAIADFLKTDGKVLGILLKKIIQLNQWNDYLRAVLGDEAKVADHCKIVNLSNNALIVIADSPHWVTRLRFYIPDILPKLQKYPGLHAIKAICCKVNPAQHTKHNPTSRKTLKLSSHSAKQILESANATKDPKLSMILAKIAQHTD